MKSPVRLNHLIAMPLLALITTFSVHAAGFVKGQVEFVRTHDAASFPTWAAPMSWVTLKGVSAAGTCAKWATGTVLFVINDKQMFSQIMLAQATGLEVAIHYDESFKINGYCAARYITTGNPAPLQ